MCCSPLASYSNTLRMQQRPRPKQRSSRSARQRTVVSRSAVGLDGEEAGSQGLYRCARRLRPRGGRRVGKKAGDQRRTPRPHGTQARNGPGVRRGRDAAIRLLQGNARAGRYYGPPALLPAFSPEWVISLAIHRSIFNQLLHPGEGLAPGSTPPARASSRVSSSLLLNCLGADGTPSKPSGSVPASRWDYRVTTTEQGAFLTT